MSAIDTKREHPVLFSAPMVRAILAGTQTQTRRAVKLPPAPLRLGEWKPTRIGGDGSRWADGSVVPDLGPGLWHTRTGAVVGSPYGAPGDRLWVRETWGVQEILGVKREHHFSAGLQFAADLATSTLDVHLDQWRVSYEKRGKWRPSIHMPRWASRIDLEITEVRVQRLQDISEDDARAEGIRKVRESCYVAPGSASDLAGLGHNSAEIAFACLWDEINGAGAWDANPWVWVVGFKRVRP